MTPFVKLFSAVEQRRTEDHSEPDLSPFLPLPRHEKRVMNTGLGLRHRGRLILYRTSNISM